MAINQTDAEPAFVMEVLKGIGRMFYVVDTAETSFPDLGSLPKPNYVSQAMPYFFGMILLEWTILWLRGKEDLRINDSMMSIIHGLIMTVVQLFASSTLFVTYLFLWRNHSVYRLPWDSTWTWVVAMLAVDFCYYWIHRAAHEVNILWAAHQVHHSSEDYNLTTALRQSAFQSFGSWVFYLPMAFFVPPSHFMVHAELNLLYQFWIHTELVNNLGPLEYIFNTASHHRVHHGANRYCLDNNYAGFLIWDRMFGTFRPELDDMNIVYGLVDQPQFFNPIKHQLFYYGKVVEKARSMSTWKESLFAFIKGPGWFPGTPRLGDETFVPEGLIEGISQTSCFVAMLYIFWTFTSIGFIYDKNKLAWYSELLRCVASLYFLLAVSLPMFQSAMVVIYAGSMMVSIWFIGARVIKNSHVTKKDQ